MYISLFQVWDERQVILSKTVIGKLYIYKNFFFYYRTNTYSNAEDFHEALSSSLHFFTEDGGVLIFMYSVILTKVNL